MAYHHHHHHHATTCCSTSSCSQCCQPPPPPPPPPPHLQQSDHLLQALASLLLQTQQPPQSQQNQTYFLKTFQDQNPASKKHHFHQKQHHQQQEHDFVLSSLVSRINALESSLQHFSRTSNFYSHPSCALRDAAARVIQTHFRAFLVHRSRTLRQLKDLAFIKSSLNSLKLSISNKTHFDCEAATQKATNLLLKLDSFQGGDPMIRDGKRSISRDLVQFLEYIDGLALKRHRHLYKNAKNVRVLGNIGSKARLLRSNYGEKMEILRDRVEKLERLSSNKEGDDVELEGFHQVIGEEENPRISITRNRNGGLVNRRGSQQQARAKKTVSFAENGNVYRIISSGNEVGSSGDGSLTDESVSSDDHAEVVENLLKERGGLVENLDNEESLQSSSSQGEKITRRNLTQQTRSEIDGDYYQIEDGDFVFSAPLPVKMESKAELMKKIKGALKIESETAPL